MKRLKYAIKIFIDIVSGKRYFCYTSRMDGFFWHEGLRIDDAQKIIYLLNDSIDDTRTENNIENDLNDILNKNV